MKSSTLFLIIAIGSQMLFGCFEQNAIKTQPVDRSSKSNYITLKEVIRAANTINEFATNSSVVWQYDKLRTQMAEAIKQDKIADEFNRTNQNRTVYMMGGIINFAWTPKRGDIEFGYRADGVVMWRECPEGMKP
jgi:hypothetical protein